MKFSLPSPFLLSVLLCAWFLSGCTSVLTDSSLRSPNLQKAAQSYYALGVAYVQKQRYDLAVTKLQRSIENHATPDAYNALALAYESQQKNALAQASYEQLLEQFPDYPRGYLNYQVFLCRNNRLQLFNRITQRTQALGETIAAVGQIGAGDCALHYGNAKQAQRHYNNALRLKPDAAGALLPLAEMAIQRGDWQMAKQQVEHVNNYIGYSAHSVYLSLLIARHNNDVLIEDKMTRLLHTRFANSEEANVLSTQSVRTTERL